MIGDAAGATGATARLELDFIEEGTILLLLSFLRFVGSGRGGGCSTRSNDDSLTMMSLIGRYISIFIINNIVVVVVFVVVAVAPSTEAKRMHEEVASTPPRRMLE